MNCSGENVQRDVRRNSSDMRIYAQLLRGQSGKKDIRRNLFQGMRRVRVLLGIIELHFLIKSDREVREKVKYYFAIFSVKGRRGEGATI